MLWELSLLVVVQFLLQWNKVDARRFVFAGAISGSVVCISFSMFAFHVHVELLSRRIKDRTISVTQRFLLLVCFDLQHTPSIYKRNGTTMMLL